MKNNQVLSQNYANTIWTSSREVLNQQDFQKDKLDFAKDYLQELEDKRQAEIDAMFARGEGGTGQDFTGGRFDGASSKAEYDADPTGFSGSS